MTEAERRAALEQIAAEVRGCTRCQLHRGRTHAVPGEGSPSTEVVLIGEGPGLNEDRQGRPFVGQAGSLLTELIESIGWQREEVFITNVVKCRPPGNRDPEPSEIASCAPFLERQLAVLEPALVVTLGRHSMGRFMPGARIGQAHGTVRPAEPEVGPPGAHVFAMYHPAAALHQQSLRRTLFDDMRGIPTALLEARAARDAAAALASGGIVAPEAAAPEPRATPVEPAWPPRSEPIEERPTGGAGALVPHGALRGAESAKTEVDATGAADDAAAAEDTTEVVTTVEADDAVAADEAGTGAAAVAGLTHRAAEAPPTPGGVTETDQLTFF